MERPIIIGIPPYIPPKWRDTDNGFLYPGGWIEGYGG